MRTKSNKASPVLVQPKPPAADSEERLLGKRDVVERTGLSYQTIWHWMQQDRFPRSRDLGGRKVVWLESEINDWITSLPKQRLKGDAEKEAAAS